MTCSDHPGMGWLSYSILGGIIASLGALAIGMVRWDSARLYCSEIHHPARPPHPEGRRALTLSAEPRPAQNRLHLLFSLSFQ